MSFVSYEFIAFLTALIVIYYLIPGDGQWILLLVISYLFYVWGSGIYVLYPVITTVSTWFLARKIGTLTLQSETYLKEHKLEREEKKRYRAQIQKKQKRFLIAGLVFNFGILAVLKYSSFVLNNVNSVMGIMGTQIEVPGISWILPLGISYYTFQSMGYLIDVYCQKYEPEKNLAKFSLFVSFFPQLISGPISRYEHMKKELYGSHKFQMETVKTGIWRAMWGYFKKLVIADRLGPAVTLIIGAPEIYDGIYVLFAMIGYVIWLYADFSGCMDIVLGVAQSLGICLPENFERPFFSKNFGEFWRRWHISLMMWFKDYIFLPVSTSRFCRKLSNFVSNIWGKRAGTKSRLYVATMVVWLTSGIWHGASWTFVTWGLVNGILLLISQELTGWRKRFHHRVAFSNTRIYQGFQVIRTFLLFTFVEMFGYYPFKTVFAMLWSLITGSDLLQLWDGRFQTLGLNGADIGILTAGIILVFVAELLERKGSLWKKLERQPGMIQYAMVFGMVLLIIVTGVYGHGYDASQFIYNQF